MGADHRGGAQRGGDVSDDVKAVEFVAEIRQVKTMADHTVNVTLNLPEYCGEPSAWFMLHHGMEVKGIVVIYTLETNETTTLENDTTETEIEYRRSGSLG